MVVADVQAVPGLALAGHAGPDDLAEPIDVVGPAAERALDGRPQRVAPRLGAEHPVLHAERLGIAALLDQALGNVQHERRRAAQPGRPEVLQQQVLARGVPRGDRHHRHADALGAVVKPQAAGEQAVAVGHVQHVAGAGAGRDHDPGHHLAPHVEVAGRVADDGRLALRARGGVHAGQLAGGHGTEAEGIVLAQVALAHEGQVGELGQAIEPHVPQAAPVERHPVDRPRHALP